jgi:hypothetical protein
MLIEKLHMLVYYSVSKEHKVSWLKQWNEFRVMKEAKKFPKHGFSNIQFDKWLHKGNILVPSKP